MRFAPAARACWRSADTPGAETGRTPNVRSKACNWAVPITVASGTPLSSDSRTTGIARPIQSADASWPRFSKRKIAIRTAWGFPSRREQPARQRRAMRATPAARDHGASVFGPDAQARRPAPLQYTRIQFQQGLKLRQRAQRRELGRFGHFLLFAEALLQRLTQILDG